MTDIVPSAVDVTALHATIDALRQELDERSAERDIARAGEVALAEVMDVINCHPANLAPVFDALLTAVVRLSNSSFGFLTTYDGEIVRVVAACGVALPENAVFRVDPGTLMHRIVLGEDIVSLADITDDDAYRAGAPSRVVIADQFGARTQLMAGLRKEARLLGFINIFRTQVRPFTGQQLAMVKAFAAQAVIAIENARLVNETREALEQQTATAEVLQVINASPGNLMPVFDAMLEKALRLCNSAFGIFGTYDGEYLRTVATRGLPNGSEDLLQTPQRPVPGLALYRIVQGQDAVQIADITDDDAYRQGLAGRRFIADICGGRTQLLIALRKNDTLVGVFNIFRQEVPPVLRQANRVAAKLRRPGGDRNGERAPAG